MAVKKPLCLYGETIYQLKDGDETANASFRIKTDATDPTSGLLDSKCDNTTVTVDTTAHKLKVVDGVYEFTGVAATLDGLHLVAYAHGDIAHSNRAVLDATSASFTTALKSTYDGYTTGKEDANVNIQAHISSTSNPHTVTKTQVGLANVANVDTTNATNITSGTLPATQLPAYAINSKGAVTYPAVVAGIFLKDDGSWGSPAGAGTVLSVSVVTANGVSGTVATADSTPAITLTLGNIVPTTCNGLTLKANAVGFEISGGTTSKTLTVPLDASVSGTNTGDNATNSQYSGLVTNATHTGDATGSGALTVVRINGTSLAGLATGALMNTTTTGVPTVVAPSTSGNLLTSNGTAWTSAAPVISSGGVIATFQAGNVGSGYTNWGTVNGTAFATIMSTSLSASSVYRYRYRLTLITSASTVGFLLGVKATSAFLVYRTNKPTTQTADSMYYGWDSDVGATTTSLATGWYEVYLEGSAEVGSADTLLLRLAAETAAGSVTYGNVLLELYKIG